MLKAEVIQVIEVHSQIGVGQDGDPVRTLISYWTLNGKLLAQIDTWKEAEAKRPSE